MIISKERFDHITNRCSGDIPCLWYNITCIPSGLGAFKGLICLMVSKISSSNSSIIIIALSVSVMSLDNEISNSRLFDLSYLNLF